MKRLNVVSVLLAASLLFLSACVTDGGGIYPSADQPPEGLSQDHAGPVLPDGFVPEVPAVPPLQNLRPVKVGLLLPLSGDNAQLGQSMLKAAQMALFDVGYEAFELVPRDTGTTPAQAQEAARSALAEGSEILLGPVFSESVKAVKPIADSAGVTVISFSTDQTLAGGNTYVMGFLPFDQINRIVQYAASQNIKRVGVLAPNSDYGKIAANAYQSIAGRVGIQTTQTERFGPQSAGINDLMRRFTKFDERSQPGQHPMANYNNVPFEAVFMPTGGDSAKMIGSLLSQYDLPPSRVKRLGTGLFDDPSLTSEPGLEGAWFAAPSPNARASFEKRFRESYNVTPPRLSTLAYDATALAAVLAQRGLSGPANKPAYDRASITSANGFAGIDGIFRFRSDNTAERGLAVLELRHGRIGVIEEAPRTFQPYAPF